MERFTCVGKVPQFYWSGLKKKESTFIIIIVLLWQSEDNHVESFFLLPLCEIQGMELPTLQGKCHYSLEPFYQSLQLGSRP